MSDCLHCSTPLTALQEKFCCRGCESVYDMIHEDGHDLFYQLKDKAILTPLGEKPFQEKNWDWLVEMAKNHDASTPLTLGVSGLSCIACVWLVESIAKKTDGVLQVHVSSNLGAVELSYQKDKADLPALAQHLHNLGYDLLPKVQADKAATTSLTMRLGICGALAMNTMAFTLPRYTGMETSDELHSLLTYVTIASSTLTFLIGSSYFFKRAWSALKLGGIHMDLPISLGLILAFLGSFYGWATGTEELFYFDFVAIFTFLMLLGKYLQTASLNKANARFQTDDAIPESYEDAEGNTILTSEITADTVLQIPSGTVIPTDARLLTEQADCSLAWITGEPASRLYKKTDPLPAGAVNQSRDSITVQATDSAHSFGAANKLTPQRTTSDTQATFIRYYLIAILIIGIASGATWWALGYGLTTILQIMISVFVVSCPCGIGLALPLLDSRFNKLAGKTGVFPITQKFWGNFRRLSKVVFDKTGTLTLDRPSLHEDTPISSLTSEQQNILFTLTKGSLHPLSRSLFSALVNAGSVHHVEGETEEIAGVGVKLTTKDDEVYSLRRSKEHTSAISCAFYKGEEVIADFRFHESAREDAKAAIDSLQRRLPRPCTILSGDDEPRVQQLAEKLGIKEYQGNLLPEQKLERIQQFQKDGNVLYIGDGINDLPALHESSLSGAPFSNLNLVTQDVDFLFTDETMAYLPTVLTLAKIRQHLSNQLVFFTLLYNVSVITFAALGHMSPFLAAVLMPLSSLISLFIVARKYPTPVRSHG